MLLEGATVMSEIFALLVFCAFDFTVIYCLWFQKAVIVRCCRSWLQLNFQVFNIFSFLQPRIINNRENFQNYGTCHYKSKRRVLAFMPGEEERTRTRSCMGLASCYVSLQFALYPIKKYGSTS